MDNALRRTVNWLYLRAARPLLFARSPDTSHRMMIRALSVLDAAGFTAPLQYPPSSRSWPTGGVSLPLPVMVAAGLVKGTGFDDERKAVEAARRSNIVPGWRSVPLMCGPVEFGSYTRFPRLGNSGTVMWRDRATQTTQNRVGLRNPGAMAAAEFLSARAVPGVYGISVATTPGIDRAEEQAEHVEASLRLFLDRGVRPSWFTINLSCPNTEADPRGAQTGELADRVCAAAVRAAGRVPVWVKVGPDLSADQYATLTDAFGAAGIRAVVATNTLSAPVDGTGLSAGVGGGRLFVHAIAAVRTLADFRARSGARFDIIGCGGVLDGRAVRAYTDAGAGAVQVWSALVFRGPFAPSLLTREYEADLENTPR